MDQMLDESGTPGSARRGVLVVCAHPDDCEFWCGGTIATWTQHGAQVTLIVLTDGSRGSHDPKIGRADLARTRQQEQHAGAKVLGIGQVVFIGEMDGELAESERLLRRIASLIRELRPGAVVLHDPWRPYEAHPDHLAAGTIVWKALFRAGEPRFYSDGPRTSPWRAEQLFCFGAHEPNYQQRVSEEAFGRKIAAILCHVSQYESSMGIVPGDRRARDDWIRTLREEGNGADGSAAAEHFRVLPVKPVGQSRHPAQP